MKYYLKTTVTQFYDPHGSPDTGGVKKEVIEFDPKFMKDYDDDYSKWEERVWYVEAPYEWKTDDDCIKKEDDPTHHYGQDGYNCKVDSYMIKEITEEESLRAAKIISDYNSLEC